MKRSWIRSLAVCALAFLMAVSFCIPFSKGSVQAKDTTYTVRIFAGNQGTIDGKDVKIYEDQAYGQEIQFNLNSVQVKNPSKYYVRGIRESGKDNNTVSSLSTITVSRDADYVVAYGIRGNSVEYTVNYVDKDGKTLAPSETYYGNIGDKPVVAYLYIEGYLPQAKNITGTLKENPSDNQFTFSYSEKPKEKVQAKSKAATKTTAKKTATTKAKATTQKTQSTPVTIVTPTTPRPSATTARQTSTTATPGTGGAANSHSTTATTASSTSTTASSSSSSTTSSSATTAAPTPVASTPAVPSAPSSIEEVPDLVDIDNQTASAEDVTTGSPEETTQAGITDSQTPQAGMSTPAKVGVGIGSVAAIAAAAGALYYFLVYKSHTPGTGMDEGSEEDIEDDSEE